MEKNMYENKLKHGENKYNIFLGETSSMDKRLN